MPAGSKSAEFDETAGFLDAEAEARQLVDALTQLREETEGYMAAERSLEQTGSRICELSARIQELTARAAESLERISSVGGPQILEEVRGVREALTRQSDTLREEKRLLDGLKVTADQSAGAIKKLDSAAQANQEAVAGIRATLAEQASAVAALGGRATEHAEALAGLASLTKRLGYVAGGGLALALIAAVIAILR